MYIRYCTIIDTDGDLKLFTTSVECFHEVGNYFYSVAQLVYTYVGIIGMVTTNLRRLICINDDILVVVIIALQYCVGRTKTHAVFCILHNVTWFVQCNIGFFNVHFFEAYNLNEMSAGFGCSIIQCWKIKLVTVNS